MGGAGGKRLPEGQGTKRKTDVEFKDAYSIASELAPPPVGRDIMAVPAKLRRIMNLKSAVASGERYNPNAHKRQRNEVSKAAKKNEKKMKLNDEKSKPSEGESKGDLPAAKKTKLSRAEEEMKMLNARLDRKSGVKPKSSGEKWKRLQAIESYRQRKKWAERPGQKLPSLDLAVAVPEL
ncbi:hypothetical protein R1flu_017339 [Riccia fluitans]|uniref:Uncharacterized protein n=1 Tax=Riccia fluitans TaxID=41844 RepID=A0ABD1ZDY5_9MARC